MEHTGRSRFWFASAWVGRCAHTYSPYFTTTSAVSLSLQRLRHNARSKSQEIAELKVRNVLICRLFLSHFWSPWIVFLVVLYHRRRYRQRGKKWRLFWKPNDGYHTSHQLQLHKKKKNHNEVETGFHPFVLHASVD